MSTSSNKFNKSNLKNFINGSKNITSIYTNTYLFPEIIGLCDNIQNSLCIFKVDKFLINNNKNSNEEIKEFNILFNIYKKIYEARDKYLLKKIQNPFSNNYILKFIRNLDDEEYNYIVKLLEKKYKTLFIDLYDIFKHTKSDKISKAFLLFKTEDIITFLSPKIKQNKYIKIPDDNDSDIKKVYFILLLQLFRINSIDISKFPYEINFLKKVLSNNYWDKFVDKYKPDKEIVYDEEIMLAYCLGHLCGFIFNDFIEMISRKIIEEQKQNITTTSEKVKNAKDIVDLFEIYYIIKINKDKANILVE
jgi:hypothetical protein